MLLHKEVKVLLEGKEFKKDKKVLTPSAFGFDTQTKQDLNIFPRGKGDISVFDSAKLDFVSF